jgi:hypothetical protein
MRKLRIVRGHVFDVALGLTGALSDRGGKTDSDEPFDFVIEEGLEGRPRVRLLDAKGESVYDSNPVD